MTIKLPVAAVLRRADTGGMVAAYIEDADGNRPTLDEIAAALNATATAPDLAALVDRILDTLHHQGLTTWGCFSIEDAEALRAEAFTAVLDILKDGTP